MGYKVSLLIRVLLTTFGGSTKGEEPQKWLETSEV